MPLRGRRLIAVTNARSRQRWGVYRAVLRRRAHHLLSLDAATGVRDLWLAGICHADNMAWRRRFRRPSLLVFWRLLPTAHHSAAKYLFQRAWPSASDARFRSVGGRHSNWLFSLSDSFSVPMSSSAGKMVSSRRKCSVGPARCTGSQCVRRREKQVELPLLQPLVHHDSPSRQAGKDRDLIRRFECHCCAEQHEKPSVCTRAGPPRDRVELALHFSSS